MKAHTYRNCFLAVAITFSLQSTSNGDVISIDFDEVTRSFTYSGSATSSGGLVPLAGQTGTWNQLAIGTAPLQNLGFNLTRSTANTNAPSFANLLDGTGAVTPATFTLNPGGALSGNSYSSFTFGPPGIASAPTDDLGRDVAMLENNPGANRVTSPSVDWEFTNLLPNTAYNIRIFGQTDNGNTPNRFGDFSVNGGTVQTTTAGQNYVDFASQLSDASGRLYGTLEFIPANGSSGMSGIQIEGEFSSAAAPEPSTFVMAALGLVSLSMRRRRSRKR